MLGDIRKVEHIYIACGCTDLRRGIDGLAQIVQNQFSLDPCSEAAAEPQYNKVPGITRCGCWAHLRRKFVKAMPPESNASTPAQIGRDLCDKFFAVKKEIQSLPLEQRQEKRLAVEQPMLRAFWCWLDELSTQPLAGSLKKAVEYAQ